MNPRENHIVQALCTTVAVFILTLSFTAYSAPATPQMSSSVMADKVVKKEVPIGLSNPSFERGLEGWTKTGTAFDSQPTYGENVIGSRVNPISTGGDYWTDIPFPIGIRGDYWIGTFERHPKANTSVGATQGDEPTGTLTSTSFRIPADTNFITFLIGGGNNVNTLKIELLEVSGATYAPIPGSAPKTGLDSELLRRDWWNVGALDKTKVYAIRITDNATGRWGHINIDDIRFEKTDPRTTRLANGQPSVLQTTIGKTTVWTDYDAKLWGAADLHTHPMSHLAIGARVVHGAPDVGAIAPRGTIKQGSGCNSTDIRTTSVAQALPDCSATHGGWGTDNSCGDTIRAFAINIFIDDKNIHKLKLPHEASCNPSMDTDAGLCYPKCKAGYHGIATMCHKDCPTGFRDDILYCAKPASYGRGTGYPMGTDIYPKKSYGRGNGYSWDPFKGDLSDGRKRCEKDNPSGCEEGSPSIWYPKCKDGYKSIGLICWENCRPGYNDDGLTCRADGLTLARANCERENAQGCEQYGLMYYPKCRSGFHAVECCICSPNCPSGMTDIGVSCQKNGSYDRGIGKPPLSNVHGDHMHAGYPTMAYWPHSSSISHQQMYIDWIRRAHEGGLNVLVALAVNNGLLAELVSGDSPKDDRANIDRQVDEIRLMIARHTDFMREVKTAAEFRKAVKDGKLAVVVGVEIDDIGNFTVGNPTLSCSADAVKKEIQRLYNEKGVRYMLPLHFADNCLGGVAIKGWLFNLSNRFMRTRPLPIGQPFPPGFLYEVETGVPGIKYRLSLFDLKNEAELASSPIFNSVKGLIDGLGMTPFPPAFDAIKCPIPQLSCIPQYKLLSSLFSPDLEWSRYQATPGGHMNKRTLQPVGELAIKEMMRLGMIIDIDHMSYKTANAVLDIAHKFGYPVNSGHTGPLLMPGLEDEDYNENGRTPDQLQRIGNLGGLMGIGWGEKDLGSYVASYKWALEHSPGPAYTLGSDINGLVRMPPPRPGSHVVYCLANDTACRRQNPNAIHKYAFGTTANGQPRYWDYNLEGVSHIGLYPDAYQDMKNIDNGREWREKFFSATDAFARMWDKIEVRKASVK